MYYICTRYQKHDSTFAALAVAGMFRYLGHDFRILPLGWRSKHVDMRWDHVVDSNIWFWEELDDARMVVWTEHPPMSYINWLCSRPRGRVPYNILYTAWDVMREDDDLSIKMFDNILVPTESQAEIFRRLWGLQNVRPAPYTPWLAPTIKIATAQPGRLSLFLSLFGSQLRRVDLKSIARMVTVLRRHPHVSATIAASKGLRLSVRRALAHTARRTDNQLRYIDDCPWHRQIELMAYSDLTIWPALHDGFSIIPRTSLALGTPVLAFDQHPANTTIGQNVSGILTPTGIERNWLGMGIARPDWDAYETALDKLIADPTRIQELMRGASIDVEPTHKVFVDRWHTLINP